MIPEQRSIIANSERAKTKIRDYDLTADSLLHKDSGCCRVASGTQYGWFQSFACFRLFPGVPFFHQFPVHNASDIDTQQRNGFPGLSYLDIGSHTSNDLFAVDQLILNAKGILGIDKEVVEVQDALTEPLQIAVTRGWMPDIIRRDDLIQRRNVSGGIHIHQFSKDRFPGLRRILRRCVVHDDFLSGYEILPAQEARSHLRRAGQQRRYATNLWEPGAVMLQAWSHLEEAMELHKKEQAICEELGDKDDLRAWYGNQALILQDWGRFEEAMVFLKEKEAICQELGRKESLAYCHANWALAARQQSNRQTEKEKLEQALALFTELGMPREVANVQAELDKTNSTFQQTANCQITICLTQGVHPTGLSRPDRQSFPATH